MKQSRSKVTVVVPVYADWSSLGQCIDSLIAHLPNKHNVIFVNDCGPDAELLEKNILKKIKKYSNMAYYRNDHNRGFVQTCNRAVYELDKTDNDILLLNSDTIVTAGFLEEMQAVLYESDRHGTVCPRSNNATIATIPFINVDNTDDRNLEYSYAVYQKIKDKLPRYHVVPVVIGFCMLIRRDLIRDYGLFDEVYRLGYGEECDFCQRINKYGYSSVMANHAYVYHLESRSFSSEKKSKMKELNEKVLHGRYPYYDELVQRYIRDFMHPVDWFADLIGGTRTRKKVMINLLQVPLVYNGTARNAVTLLNYIRLHKKDYKNFEFTIVASQEASKFHQFDQYGFDVKSQGEINDLYDIGYSPSQIFTIDHLMFMNRHCYRIVVSLLDIIAIRSNKLLAHDYRKFSVFSDTIKIADKIITISDAAKDDIFAYFGEKASEHKEKFLTVHQGYSDEILFKASHADMDKDIRSIIDKKSYLLVLGNDFDFKRVKEAVQHLKDTEGDIIVLGCSSRVVQKENIHYVPTGFIDDNSMRTLQRNAKVIIFPSVYEGFGLPIAESAMLQRPIVISDTASSRELIELYGKTTPIAVFSQLADLPKAVSDVMKVDFDASYRQAARSMNDYNKEVLSILVMTANDPSYNGQALKDRWGYMSQLTNYLTSHTRGQKVTLKKTVGQIMKRYTPGLFTVAQRYYHRVK